MSAKLTLEVVTPYGVTFSDEVDYVHVKGIDGELGILPEHEPLFTALQIDLVKYEKNDEVKYIAVMGGFVDIYENKVSILSDSAELAEDIDVLRANRAKQDAETLLLEQVAQEKFEKIDKDIQKALARIKAAEAIQAAAAKKSQKR